MHSGTPSANCKAGVVIGRYVESPQGVKVEEYLGIPFAKPPVGELRYSDPVLLETLPKNPYEANNYRNACIQPIDETFGTFPGSDMWNVRTEQNEDCLFLNIWAPLRKDSNSLKSVMVWVYGGGFYSGSNSLWIYNGKTLAAFGDVIIVSLNYRVGSFGYLSTGDGRIKGNFGMKDQVIALTWIKDNIEAFGGNPASVTIFGESSGASSAGLHQMSEHSRHLFTRAIYQSGSPDSQWSFMTQKQARSRSEIFFRKVNCHMHEEKALLTCLRGLSAKTILDNEGVDNRFMVFPWVPSVDGDFLVDTPYNLLKNGSFQHKDAILGVNRDEGTFCILFALPGFSKDNSSLQSYEMFQTGVDIIAHDLNRFQRDQIKQLYTVADGRDMDANRDALDKVCGDRSFTCPTEELAEFYDKANISTYFYYLTYRATEEVWPSWMGVIHGADIQWIFGMPLNKSGSYTEEEKEFSRTIMSYWVNFAKTGDPNGHSLPDWPKFSTRTHPEYLELRGHKDFVKMNTFRQNYCSVWREINKELRRDS